MKSLLTILTVFSLSCSGNLANEARLSRGGTFNLDCKKPDIDNTVIRSDTTFDYNNYKGHTIKSFDNKGRVIQVYVSNLFESNSKSIYSETSLYDTAGNIVYEDKTQGFTLWHCYCYKYDTKGNLIFLEGYSSGEIGIKKTFVYEDGRLVKEIIERPSGKVEKKY